MRAHPPVPGKNGAAPVGAATIALRVTPFGEGVTLAASEAKS
jgi:hypothetical protein